MIHLVGEQPQIGEDRIIVLESILIHFPFGVELQVGCIH
jgi:hypothetical protein